MAPRLSWMNSNDPPTRSLMRPISRFAESSVIATETPCPATPAPRRILGKRDREVERVAVGIGVANPNDRPVSLEEPVAAHEAPRPIAGAGDREVVEARQQLGGHGRVAQEIRVEPVPLGGDRIDAPAPHGERRKRFLLGGRRFFAFRQSQQSEDRQRRVVRDRVQERVGVEEPPGADAPLRALVAIERKVGILLEVEGALVVGERVARGEEGRGGSGERGAAARARIPTQSQARGPTHRESAVLDRGGGLFRATRRLARGRRRGRLLKIGFGESRLGFFASCAAIARANRPQAVFVSNCIKRGVRATSYAWGARRVSGTSRFRRHPRLQRGLHHWSRRGGLPRPRGRGRGRRRR